MGVIGLGYVGLPRAIEFAQNGFAVTGFDVDTDKASQINAGQSYDAFRCRRLMSVRITF